MNNSAAINNSKSTKGGFLNWMNQHRWIVIADVVGFTMILGIAGSMMLGQWLMMLPALVPIIFGIASLKSKPVKKVEAVKPKPRKVSDIRIVITPREDEYGYSITT